MAATSPQRGDARRARPAGARARRSAAASTTSAASSCPRRSSPRSRSSKPSSAPRGPPTSSGPSSPRCSRRTRAGPRRSPSATTSRSASASGCCSSARTSPTRARTRSTTCSARRCSRGAWASGVSSRKPVPGQHGVATATACALFGLDCTVFMGAVDVQRQALNVWRMQLLGAEVVPVAVGESHAEGRGERRAPRLGRVGRDHALLSSGPWSARTRTRGSCASSSASSATKRASSAAAILGADPDVVVACVGGGSNAIGTFAGFLDTDARLVGVEAGGLRARERAARRVGEPAASPGCCTARARSTSRTRTARSSKRTRSVPASTTRASDPSTPRSRARARPVRVGHRRRCAGRVRAARGDRGHRARARTRARDRLAGAAPSAPRCEPGSTVLVTLSGRGDKDAAQVAEILGRGTRGPSS